MTAKKKKPATAELNYVTTVEKPVSVTLVTKGAAIKGDSGRDDAAQTIDIALVPWSSSLSNEPRCVELLVTDQYNNTVSVVVEGEALEQSLRDLLDG